MQARHANSTRSGWIDSLGKIVRDDDTKLFLQIFQDYFRRFWRSYVMIFVLIGIASVTTAAAAWLVKDIVNSVFADQSSQLLLSLVLAVLAIFMARGLSTYFQTVISQRVSNSIVADIQARLMRHVLAQRMAFFSRNTSDTLLMRFNQGAQAFNSILTLVLVNGLRDLATLIALLVVMLIQDPWLTLISLAVAPLVFFGVTLLLRKMREVSQEEVAGIAELNRLVRETVQGITVIKAYNLETTQDADAQTVIEGIRQRRNKMAMLQAAPIPLLDAVGGIAVALAVLYAGIRMASGGYDAGTFMSFLTALLLAADPARRLSQVRVRLRRSLAVAQKVMDLLNKDTSESQGSKLPALPSNSLTTCGGSTSVKKDSAVPAIAFKNVEFAYSSKKPVLRGADLIIDQGKMVALVGPSGAGKSTLFKLLLKFHEPNAGRIELFGTDIAVLKNTAVRDVISYVGQVNYIFAGSIFDNLTLGRPHVDVDQVETACRTVGLHDDIMALPNGYQTDVGELGSLISGGQAQRVNMARAIIKDAPILLLDEVTSALDAENEKYIKDYMRQQSGAKSILVIAHRLSTVREAECIALVQDGRITAQGRHDDLVSSNDYYERIVSLQLVA